MKGIVFNLLEEVVCEQHGEEAWDNLLDAAQVSGSYTSLGSYPDLDIQKLVMAASEALKTPPAEVLRWFGRAAMPKLAQRFPTFFDAYQTLRPFVLSLNSIIHPEVHKLYPGASCPVFKFDEEADGALLIGYRSPRKLCNLAQGFLEGAAVHFNESAVIEHRLCMHSGDDHCLMRVAVVPLAA